jgi:hypothetical protein
MHFINFHVVENRLRELDMSYMDLLYLMGGYSYKWFNKTRREDKPLNDRDIQKMAEVLDLDPKEIITDKEGLRNFEDILIEELDRLNYTMERMVYALLNYEDKKHG